MVGLLDISVSGRKPKPKIKTGIVRSFEDGTVEVALRNGTRVRKIPVPCSSCGKLQIHHRLNRTSSLLEQRGICLACFDTEEAARQAAIELERLSRLNDGLTGRQRRQMAMILATPLWRDRAKIRAIYDECARLTELSGIVHHVDHIYPIQSRHACGLHVHHNLQILTGEANMSKSNKFPLDNSPALK